MLRRHQVPDLAGALRVAGFGFGLVLAVFLVTVFLVVVGFRVGDLVFCLVVGAASVLGKAGGRSMPVMSMSKSSESVS